MTALRLTVVLLLCMALPLWAGSHSSCPDPPPVDPGLYSIFQKAQKSLEAGRIREALKALSSYADAHPKKKHYHLSYLMGTAHYLLEQPARAETQFLAAAELRPCMGEIWQNIGAVRYEKGDYAGAADAMETAYARIRPEKPELQYQAAVYLLKAGQTEKAVGILKRLNRSAQPETAWIQTLVHALVEQDKPKAVAPFLKQLLAAAPESPELWRLASWVAARQERYGDAAAALSVAYRLKPPDSEGWRKLGDLYRLAGVPLEAAQAYRNAFGNDPGPRDLDRLTDTYLEAHDLERALDTVRLAVRKAPTARRWGRIGDIRFRLRQHQGSLAAYRQAAVLDDKGGRMSLMAGAAALELEHFSDAEACFTQALCRAAPGSQTARDASRCLEALKASKKNAPSRERGMD